MRETKQFFFDLLPDLLFCLEARQELRGGICLFEEPIDTPLKVSKRPVLNLCWRHRPQLNLRKLVKLLWEKHRSQQLRVIVDQRAPPLGLKMCGLSTGKEEAARDPIGMHDRRGRNAYHMLPWRERQ